MEWPSGRWRAPAAEMGPQQQFSTTQSCICWHIFLLVIFLLLLKMYFAMQFCIGVFSFCLKLTFGEIFVGKLQGTTMKRIESVVNLLSKSFSILIFGTRKFQILYSYLILVASRLLRWEKPLRVAVDDIKHSGSSVVCGARKPREILSSDFSSIRVDENGDA